MRTTMDKAGRIVVPLALRKQVGLEPGPIDIDVDGAGVRIEPPAATVDDLIEEDGYVFLPRSGFPSLTEDEIRDLRLADQR